MSRHTAATVPIDCFVWKRESDRKDTLVYYDQDGTYFERTVDSEALDTALKIFSGQTRAVRRSSGGLVMAEPLQIVVYEGGEQQSPLHIRVRFREILTNSEGQKTSRSCTKVVAASELLEAFTWDFEGARRQTFALDFGKGIVPVYPFYYHQTESEIEAYFVDAGDWERAINGKKGERASVQVYRVTRSALRWTGPATDEVLSKNLPSEVAKARKNFERLKLSGEHRIPESFVFGKRIEVPCGGNAQDIRHFLRICVQKTLHGTPVYINVAATEEEEALLPFGMFEE